MAVSIIDKIREPSGVWRVHVSIDATESAFFWFPSDATLQEARAVVMKFVADRLAAQQDAEADASNKQTLRQALNNYTSATGNVATRNLLEAVIERLKLRDNL